MSSRLFGGYCHFYNGGEIFIMICKNIVRLRSIDLWQYGYIGYILVSYQYLLYFGHKMLYFTVLYCIAILICNVYYKYRNIKNGVTLYDTVEFSIVFVQLSFVQLHTE